MREADWSRALQEAERLDAEFLKSGLVGGLHWESPPTTQVTRRWQRIAEKTRQAVLTLMADHKLDTLVYATFDHQPVLIASDVMTRLAADDDRLGNNRRLSPVLGFPAITVPAGFTIDGLPVGIEFLARPFDEVLLFRVAYAYEQGTHHRRPPNSTPPLPGEP